MRHTQKWPFEGLFENRIENPIERSFWRRFSKGFSKGPSKDYLVISEKFVCIWQKSWSYATKQVIKQPADSDQNGRDKTIANKR